MWISTHKVSDGKVIANIVTSTILVFSTLYKDKFFPDHFDNLPVIPDIPI